MNTNTEQLPISFYRYRKDGSLNPDIKRAFLSRINVTVEDAIKGRLYLEDKSEWILVLEPEVRKRLKEHSQVLCIVSFQLRVQGAYAVARYFSEQRPMSHPTKQTTEQATETDTERSTS